MSGGISDRASFGMENLAHRLVYGVASKDLLPVASKVPVSALLFDGDGNDTLRSGSDESVLVGQPGERLAAWLQRPGGADEGWDGRQP